MSAFLVHDMQGASFMKKFFILAVLMVMAASTDSKASTVTQTCRGNTRVPSGKFILNVESDQDGPSVITVKFHNNGLNETFVGVFNVTGFQASTGNVMAKGAFQGENAQIPAGIQGSLAANQSGNIQLTAYTSADHRIEYGYGLWLVCNLD